MGSLPTEILEKIFCFLPRRSFPKLASVCISWRGILLYDPSFYEMYKKFNLDQYMFTNSEMVNAHCEAWEQWYELRNLIKEGIKLERPMDLYLLELFGSFYALLIKINERFSLIPSDPAFEADLKPEFKGGPNFYERLMSQILSDLRMGFPTCSLDTVLNHIESLGRLYLSELQRRIRLHAR